MSLTTTYIVLAVAIVSEVIGTSALLASQNFSRLGPSLLMLLFYGIAVAGMSHSFRLIPMGIVYAIWSGLGIVLIAGVGWLHFGQRLDVPAMIGLGLIVSGVVIVNAFSNSMTH